MGRRLNGGDRASQGNLEEDRVHHSSGRGGEHSDWGLELEKTGSSCRG